MPDQTRDRIVDAAYRTLVKLGYHNTSMKEIAEEAGVAPGLAHYYFDSKEDLLVAAIRRACSPLIAEWEAAASTVPADFASAVALGRQGLELQKEQLRQRLELFTLVFDMFGVGLHNPRIAEAVNEFVQEDRERIAAIANAVIAGMPAPPQTTADSIAAAVWASLNGITLQKLIDRNFDSDAAIDALWEMLVAFIGVSAAGAARNAGVDRTVVVAKKEG
jgi:AcrR family transcriptional regulator